jgi:hypothetical protein
MRDYLEISAATAKRALKVCINEEAKIIINMVGMEQIFQWALIRYLTGRLETTFSSWLWHNCKRCTCFLCKTITQAKVECNMIPKILQFPTVV